MARGEFTRKFDRDIMKDASVDAEELAALQAAQAAEKEAFELEIDKVLALLAHRSAWLAERFPVSEPGDVDFKGRRFEFASTGESVGSGWLEFRCALTDTGLGIKLECQMSVENAFKRRHDYVIFPKEAVKVEKAKKFIESKIFEFAAAWQKD